jgi:hypothetical protein
VELTVSYEFTIPTDVILGIYDVETEIWLAEEVEALVGEGTRTYSILMTAPPEKHMWDLEAGVRYYLEGDLMHDEVDWKESFVIQVREFDEKSDGIPGFPIEAIIIGVLIGFSLLSRTRVR